MAGFREMLAKRQGKANTLVCVGLDPLIEKLPLCLAKGEYSLRTSHAVITWMSRIASATAKYACMFKPQIAHWEAIPGGIEALKDTILNIRSENPDIPIFLDCKRGDIARTQQQYRIACLNHIGADGMNFSPYMGRDCMAALVDKDNLGRALVGLCYTSNPDAREVQDLMLDNGERLWEAIAIKTMTWAQELGVIENAGLVMAAAYEYPKGSCQIHYEHLAKCRQIVGDKMWFLIPGIGTQGGFVKATVRAAYTGLGSIAINSSSGITEASSGEDYAEAAATKAEELRDQINDSIWNYQRE